MKESHAVGIMAPNCPAWYLSSWAATFSGGLSAGIRIQLCQESVFDRLNGIFTIEPFEPKVQVKIQIELEHNVWGSKGLSPRRNKRLQSNISRISQDGAQPQ